METGGQQMLLEGRSSLYNRKNYFARPIFWVLLQFLKLEEAEARNKSSSPQTRTLPYVAKM